MCDVVVEKETCNVFVSWIQTKGSQNVYEPIKLILVADLVLVVSTPKPDISAHALQ